MQFTKLGEIAWPHFKEIMLYPRYKKQVCVLHVRAYFTVKVKFELCVTLGNYM